MPDNINDIENSANEAENIANAANGNGGTDGASSGELGKFADFPEFDESLKTSVAGDEKLDFLQDLQLNVYIELGRTKMEIKDILELERGYVIELEKLASEPVDVYVNNKKIAEGEVVVIDKHFGIRVTNLIDTENRLLGLQ